MADAEENTPFRSVPTGIYVRIKRGESYEPVDIGEMTEPELDDFVGKMTAAEGQKWVRGLVKWIRDHVEFEPRGETS